MILSHNSIAHLLVTLAAYAIGSPVVPVSVAYSLLSKEHRELRAIAQIVEPAAVFAENATYAAAVEALGAVNLTVSADSTGTDLTPLARLEAEPTHAIAERIGQIDANSIAKIMFTSGSTGRPKGVVNHHGMLAANQQQMRQVWPFLADEPPILADWLPWSHTFGGNHNVNMVLVNGGSLWIDDGKPTPQMIERTVRNVADVRPSIHFNVPGATPRWCRFSSVTPTSPAASCRGCGWRSSPLPVCRSNCGTVSRRWLPCTGPRCG
ncbi:hypothetical protein MPUL_43170 [Mycolicibacterium pulveris]|uniref:AMP-dependent synthetase/ligase domain-containing protein n=2 Tax=Mycolicibacterium pulveris TaxID=36813 RepID=A0A7I7URH5_MYCPV|nr:hypothetical protein MPUL_43170 [Mycolicibacterium pulveris]